MPPLSRFRFTAAFVLVFSSFFPALSAQPTEVYLVRPGGDNAAISLNGRWQFKYIAGPSLGADEAFQAPDFPATTWRAIDVPGHWELQGFAEPNYARVDEGQGLYRRTFKVPSGWNGERIFLHFDGVLYGFDAWVNGTKVGTWASAYNPVAFDITDAIVKTGGETVLAVQVTTRSKGFDFDINDCWALSGIFRDVTLFAVPAVHFTGFTHETKLQADGSAKLAITISTNTSSTGRAQLRDPNGTTVQQFEFSSGHSVTFTLAQPILWTAETPALYPLDLSLENGQHLSAKIGLREVTISDGVLHLNGRPIKLRGADHHDIWPVNGRVSTEELMRTDLELMRAANINFIRTSHYPPHPRFLELCDELGFYVMDEVPFGFGDVHLTDPSYQETLLTRARATIRRDHNHPSVIIWSVGNENANTPLTFATGQEVKKLDATRPMCFPQIGSYFARSHQELPDWVDIYAPHYPEVATVEKYAKELTRPVIFTEYAHALGLASDRIEAEWAVMQSNPRIAGGAVWMFQDQGILRAAKQPVDRQAPTISAWPDATHYYDTSGNGGMDGIVYSDRTPQTDYWEVRKVYSPVQIATQSIDLAAGANTLTFQLENRFDFRALTGIALTWTFVRNGIEVQSGTVPLHAATHQGEKITLPIPIHLAVSENDFTWLELHLYDGKNASFYEHTIRLQPVLKQAILSSLARNLSASQLRVDETAEAIKITHANFALTCVRKTGEVSVQGNNGAVLASGFLPHTGRKFTEAERLRAVKSSIWQGAILSTAEAPQIEIHRNSNQVSLIIHGRYERPDTAGQFVSGTHTLQVNANGTIAVSYDFLPDKGSTGSFLEAGLSLITPPKATELRWIGAGPYASYPGKEALNEFGFHHLNREDLNFQGNRQKVEMAALTQTTGAGVLLITPQPANIAVERNPEGTFLTHNAILSGLGNKGVGPETNISADSATHIAGQFILVPLGSEWPAQISRWLGSASATVNPFKPFYHSYDQ